MFSRRYGRHVAIPWSTLLPAFPHVRPDSAAQPEPEPEPEYAAPAETRDGQPSLAPCMAMRTLIQNYIRHASNRLEVRSTHSLAGSAFASTD